MSSRVDYVNNRVGEVRPSQLLYTYGIGSIVDLQRMSVVVLGLDDWPEKGELISEPRLRRAVQDVHSEVTELRMPPRPSPLESERAQQLIGVPVAPFPRWLRCSRCQTIGSVSSGVFKISINQHRPEEAEYVHVVCPSKGAGKKRAFPVRFLVACEEGHLDDFPWDSYVHRGQPCPHASSSLKLTKSGTAGEVASVFVTCQTCDARRPMAPAFAASRSDSGLMTCTGFSPQLRQYDTDQCAMPMKTILLGASHLWFPRVYSALHIPSAVDKVGQLVDRYRDALAKVTSREALGYFREFRGRDFPDLMAYSDDDLWEAIERQRNAEQDEDADADLDLPATAVIKLPEWDALTHPKGVPDTADFQLRDVQAPEKYRSVLASVVLVERLREVRAFIGFNRWRSMNEFGDASGAGDDSQRLAPIKRLGDPLTWVPAADVRGEGILIQLREDAVLAWEAKVWESEWVSTFREAYRARLRSRGVSEGGDDYVTFRRIMLHSLSHALMREFALESGYAAASLQERIYALAPGHGGNEMAGILIYTAATDSEGTLGGLIRLGESDSLSSLLDNALGSIEVCSSDPLCAEHTPNTEHGSDLHGAACHACLFAPETSCEMGSQLLDRSTLVSTFTGGTTAYFPSRPCK